MASTQDALQTPRRIGISTGGGDAPGLNAVIRAAVLAAHHRGWECVGIRDGLNGLLQPDQYPEGGLIPLKLRDVRGITHLGGTILGTTNRGHPLRFPTKNEAGETVLLDRSDELIQAFRDNGIDSLISIGGDGAIEIANVLAKKGLTVVHVPKTIDNDLEHTVVTFGFDSAVAFATECIDRLHSTAESHRRVMVVEVMGRYAGWIAVESGIAGSADVILIPEVPYSIDRVLEKIESRYERGSRFAIVVVAEGAKPAGGTFSVVEREAGRADRLGGAAQFIADQIKLHTEHEVRSVVLGHVLRGGTPTARDRLYSLRFGAAAVRALAEGFSNIMVALDPPVVRYVPLEEVAGRMKTVPLDSDTIKTAYDLGISFGAP